MESDEYQKEFLFPQNDKRLEKFIKLTIEQQLDSIYIGSYLREIGEDRYMRLKDGINELEKDNLKTMYEDELRERDEQNKALEKKLHENERNYINEKITLRENIYRDAKHQYETRYVDVVESLEDELNSVKSKLEKKLVEDMNKQEKAYKEKLEINKIHEEKIEKLRNSYETKLEEYRKKVEIVTELKENSAKKGQEGENWIFNELIRQFPKSSITDCSKKDRRGDFTIEDDVKGMVESKNYKKNVPRKEIVKFKKDVETNDDFKYGILLSLKSGVTNRDDFCLEFCAGKPIMFLHFIKNEPYKIKIAYKICKLILKNMECFDIKNEEIKILVKEKTKTMAARHNKMISTLRNFTKEMESQLIEQWKDFNEFLKNLN